MFVRAVLLLALALPASASAATLGEIAPLQLRGNEARVLIVLDVPDHSDDALRGSTPIDVALGADGSLRVVNPTISRSSGPARTWTWHSASFVRSAMRPQATAGRWKTSSAPTPSG